MSYILDALKKSDQQRHNSVQPTAINPATPASQATYRFWLRAIVLAAALCFAWGIMQMNQPNKPSPATPPMQKRIILQPIPPAIPTQLPQTPVHQAAETQSHSAALETHPASPPQSDIIPVFKPIIPTSSVSHTPSTADQSIADSITTDLQASTAAPAPAEESIFAIGDLPVAVQQALPAIHIDGHIYDSNPRKRMVIINGTTHKEKGHLADDLTLEEITPHGVILNFKGYVFHLGVFE